MGVGEGYVSDRQAKHRITQLIQIIQPFLLRLSYNLKEKEQSFFSKQYFLKSHFYLSKAVNSVIITLKSNLFLSGLSLLRTGRPTLMKENLSF